MDAGVLRVFSRLVAYRYHNWLTKPLQVPRDYVALDIGLIREKATTSLTAAGVFLAFSIAILVGVMSTAGFQTTIASGIQDGWQPTVAAAAIVVLVGLTIRQERVITGAKLRDRNWPYRWLGAYLVCSLLVLMIGPIAESLGASTLKAYTSQSVMKPAFAMAGISLIVASAIFLFIALELYDYAGGWAGGEGESGRNLHFHLAGLGSNSYLYGVSFALIGAALLIAELNFWLASIISVVAIITLVGVPQIERDLWSMRNPVLTWEGRLVGRRFQKDLWTYSGEHKGRFFGAEVFAPNGKYLGELRFNRLVTDLIKRDTESIQPFPRETNNPFDKLTRLASATDSLGKLPAGCEDFPVDERTVETVSSSRLWGWLSRLRTAWLVLLGGPISSRSPQDRWMSGSVDAKQVTTWRFGPSRNSFGETDSGRRAGRSR